MARPEYEPLTVLGHVIRNLRKTRGMSMRGVAEDAGITATHVHDIEHGKCINPTIATLLKLAAALECNPLMLASYAFEDQPGVVTFRDGTDKIIGDTGDEPDDDMASDVARPRG